VTERRKPTKDGREGRRPADLHCGQHAILWENNEKNRSEYRTITCGKITALNNEVAKMVPWKIFAFLFTFSVLVAGAGFGYFGAQIGKLADKQEEGLTSIRASLGILKENQSVMSTEIKANQSSLINEIETLKHRQDVLRDQNLRERKDEGRDGRDGKTGRDGRDAKP
jgi:hypothetical protein